MPIVFETIAMTLTAYTLGLAAGWIVWGRADRQESEDTEEQGHV